MNNRHQGSQVAATGSDVREAGDKCPGLWLTAMLLQRGTLHVHAGHCERAGGNDPTLSATTCPHILLAHWSGTMAATEG